MKTCPKCGAENRQTASECRLCATPLESAGDLLEARQDTGFEGSMPPDRIVSGPEPADQHAPASTYAGHNLCSNCKAVSEPDWAFCQQCGAPLEGRSRQSGAGDSQTEPAQMKPSSLGAPFVAGGRTPNTPAGARAAEAPAPGLVGPGIPPGTQGAASGPKTATTCPNCGALVPPGLMYCANCGRTVSTEYENKGPLVTTPERPSFPPDVAPGVPVPQPQPERAVIQMITEGGQVGSVSAVSKATSSFPTMATCPVNTPAWSRGAGGISSSMNTAVTEPSSVSPAKSNSSLATLFWSGSRCSSSAPRSSFFPKSCVRGSTINPYDNGTTAERS